MTERADLLSIEKQLRDLEAKQNEDKLSLYTPYQKQMQFHTLGEDHRERLLMAGNQNGKTYCGAAECAFHLTGLYPEWWTGRRWDRPIRAWVLGVTGESTRDNPQRLLLGTIADITAYGPGRGMIPKKALDPSKMTMARGVSDFYDTVLVRHYDANGEPDGWSQLNFKSYERGRAKLQGDSIDFIWCDEEPPMDVYTELLARITATAGMIDITFTPLEGMSEVVMRYLNEPSPDRAVVTMTIDDALHIPAEERAKIIAGYPAHEREARARGVPMLGSGKIFQVSRELFVVQPFRPMDNWSFIWGSDFGTQHPFAAVLLGWDKDKDILYVIQCIRRSDEMPLQHVAAMKPALWGHGNQVPMAWPQDGHQRKEFDGKLEPLAKIYKARGQKILDHHATFPDGSNSTETGIMEMQERFRDGRLKVFADQIEFLQEFDLYHRKDGEIVKLHDDIMSATRVGVMARRFAKPILFVPERYGRSSVPMAKDVDIDPWGN